MTVIRPIVALAVLAAAPPVFAGKNPLGIGERIEINRASAAELMRLPGIGKKRAQAILAYRSQHPFRRLEDLLAVRGLSPRWLQRIRGRLTVTAPVKTAPASAKRGSAASR